MSIKEIDSLRQTLYPQQELSQSTHLSSSPAAPWTRRQLHGHITYPGAATLLHVRVSERMPLYKCQLLLTSGISRRHVHLYAIESRCDGALEWSRPTPAQVQARSGRCFSGRRGTGVARRRSLRRTLGTCCSLRLSISPRGFLGQLCSLLERVLAQRSGGSILCFGLLGCLRGGTPRSLRGKMRRRVAVSIQL